MLRVRALVLGTILVVVLSACRVDSTVDIVIDDDGSGTVSLTVVADAAAVALVAGDPSELRFDDLPAAGWDLDGPTVEDGGITLVASKPFLSATELESVLAELLGPGVIFSGVEITEVHEFSKIGLRPATTDYTFGATVDPSPSLEFLGDDLLAAELDGMPLGRTLLSIETAAATSFEESLGLAVNVTMPSGASSESGEVTDETATWIFAFGDASTEIDARSSSYDILPRVWALVAIIASILLALVLLSRLGSFLLATWRVPKGRRRRDARMRQKRAATREAEANRPRRRLLRMLIVDVHGVIVRPTNPLEGLLVPLITTERPEIDPEVIRGNHRQLILGRISPEEFWSNVGLGPMADEIETRYLSSFRLVPGLHPFLDRMATSRLPVAAVGNQPRVWGDRLRRMASLEGVVSSWMVSGDVGSTLPEPALFEATRRTMSVDLYDCFYLSNVPEHLDAAKELGLATGFFVTGAEEAPETEHTVVQGFEDLLRARRTS
jgi:FMN phosphatase YigB (HAD superfamily)